MGGWRDEHGRTAADRKGIRREENLARFASDVRNRPLALLKGLAGFALVMILVFAVISMLR